MTGHHVARSFLGAAATAALLHCAGREPVSPAVNQAESITGSTFAGRVALLSADSRRGRPTPSAELNLAAAYAVAQFGALGLAPGPATGFTQTWSTGGGDAPNAVGVLPGSDPGLAGEYVVFVAHLDHIGSVTSGEGCVASGADTICNGADDNASGSAAVLELARAFAGLTPRPRRSLLFLLVSGEERGLLGSTYYVAHPAVPIAQTVAAVNLDMISRNAPDSLLVIGMGLSSLGARVGAVTAAHPELNLRPAGVGWPYGGSDHVPFGNAGVPTVMFFAGLHPDYHRPSDELARTDADKGARITRLAFYVGLDVANRTARPTWNAGAPAPVVPPAAGAWPGGGSSE